MNLKKVFMCLVMCAGIAQLTAQQTSKQQLDTVVIDSKTPKPIKNSGKVITTINAEQLAKSHGMSVAQIINRVSGIELNGSRSNAGQNLGYFVRGGRNRQVVVIIDGVAVTDPSQIANDFDLRLIPASSLEEIQILKGASSVLYGSGAATAVISLTTKQAAKKAFQGNFTSSIGTNNPSENSSSDLSNFFNAVQLSGTANNLEYSGSFDHQYTNGISAVAAPEGEPAFDSDAFNSYSATGRLGYSFGKTAKISRFFNVSNFSSEFDNFDFTDANNLSKTRLLRTGGSLLWNYNKGSVTVNDSYSWTEREIQSSFPTKFDSRSFGIDAFVSHSFLDNLNVVAGVNANFSDLNSFSVPFGGTDFNQDVFDTVADFDIIDPYVNAVFISDFGLTLNAGLRLNTHSNYDNALVYHVNPSFVKEIGNWNVKGLASYSTAYITPSLFQLYDPFYGNTDLIPEENTTIEAGVVLTNNQGLSFSAVYFNRNEKNFVDFVTVDPDLFVFEYSNIDQEFNASGVEVEIAASFSKVNLSANYTFTKPDERFELRIPEHKINASFGYQVTKALNLGIQYQYNAARNDAFFNNLTFESEAVVLDAFGILDFNANYKVNNALAVFANVTNLLNEEYQELFGFQTLGRNFNLGFSLKL